MFDPDLGRAVQSELRTAPRLPCGGCSGWEVLIFCFAKQASPKVVKTCFACDLDSWSLSRCTKGFALLKWVLNNLVLHEESHKLSVVRSATNQGSSRKGCFWRANMLKHVEACSNTMLHAD